MWDFNRKPIIAIDYKKNVVVGSYISVLQASKQLGLDRASVHRCLSGEYNHTHGYTFIYAE